VTATDWRASTRRDGDHLLWTGPTREGAPVLYIGAKRRRSMAAAIYAEHHQREPRGRVWAACHVKTCVEPTHLSDSTDRQRLYRASAEQQGLPGLGGYCDSGHAWADHAYFMAGGRRSCEACRLGDPPVDHSVGIELVINGIPEELPRPAKREAARQAVCHRGATHEAAAQLVGVSRRSVDRWASRYGWHRAVAR
jgi:hypothetical protein